MQMVSPLYAGRAIIARLPGRLDSTRYLYYAALPEIGRLREKRYHLSAGRAR
jgi:hypothetical protein